MRTLRSTTRFLTALAVVLAMGVAGAVAEEAKEKDKKPQAKESAKTTAQKEAGEKKNPAKPAGKKPVEAKVEIRIDGVDVTEAKRQPLQKLHRPPHQQDQELERRPWLGIAMREIPPTLREYLELPEGFGVQVEFVAEDSPAANGDLKVHDILTKLNDQLLISPEHVALLVRSKQKGDIVTLTFVRKGQEQTAEVTLGERDLPPFSNETRGGSSESRGGFGFQFHKPEGRDGRFEFHGNLPFTPQQKEEFQRYMREYQDSLKQLMDKNPGGFRFRQQGPEPAKPKPHPPKTDHPKNSPDAPPVQVKPIPPLPGKHEGKPPAISVSPGFPLQIFGAAGMVQIDNPKGEVTITNKGGSHKITIKNKDGETVYEGSYDDDKGSKGLPEEARKQLKEMKLDDLKLLTPPQPKNSPKPEPKEKDKGPEKKDEIL